MDEVRYQYLRPAQAIKRREEFPAAYIPIGCLEWHGPHNPLGADALQAEALAMLAAEKGGGIVFPPLYYGENRLQVLQEAKEESRVEIANEMKLPPENFLPEFYPFTQSEQARNYQTLLIHILAEVETLGFKVGVLVAGHYPQIDSARAAVLEYNLRVRHNRPQTGMLAWACMDVLACIDKYPDGGDHGAGWETSHLLYTHPECVDMSVLPPKNTHIAGLGGHIQPQDATAEFGKEILEYAAGKVVKEVTNRINHREVYARTGHWLDEGL